VHEKVEFVLVLVSDLLMCMKIIDSKLHHNANLITKEFEDMLVFDDVLLLKGQYMTQNKE